MTTSWGGTSLPDPTNITLLDDRGAQFQTIDGVLLYRRTRHRTAVSTRMERSYGGSVRHDLHQGATNSKAPSYSRCTPKAQDLPCYLSRVR